MRLERFSGPGDLVPEDLMHAVFLELASGAEPETLATFIRDRIGLPAQDAAMIVGSQNARLQERMEFVADQLEKRERPVALADGLVSEGWPVDLARSFVQKVRSDLDSKMHSTEGRRELLARTRRRMVFASLWFGGGVFATWITQYAVDHGPGDYVLLAWGPIIYGLVSFSYATFQWCRYKWSTT